MCRIAYHKLAPDVDGPWSFKCETVSEVVARVSQEEETGITQVNAGKCYPVNEWATPYTNLVCVVKTTVNGMSPVRPIIVFNQELEIPPHKALVLAGA